MQPRSIIGQPERLALNKIIALLSAHKFSQPFLSPVDYVKLGLLDYPLVVTQPMDLQTVKEKLRDHRYGCSEECLQDLMLIWENCRRYNEATNKILVKWANEMEKYQKRIMKNYFPALTMATTRKSNNKKETKMIKMEEKEKKKQDVKIEAVSIELKKIKQQTSAPQNKEKPKVDEEPKVSICLKQEPQLKQKLRKESEAEDQIQNVQNVDLKTEVAILAQQAQKSLQVIKQIGEKILPTDRKWQQRGEQIRQEFLRSLGECNDCEVTLIFMMIKRRCPKCVQYDSSGNSSVELKNIDDYTLALASQQITIWKNKAGMS